MSETTLDRAPDGVTESTELATDLDQSRRAETDARAELEAAIARLTRRLATADDEEIGDLVAERKSMRAELAELRRASLPDNVVPIKRPGS